jgi:hypothetical protein
MFLDTTRTDRKRSILQFFYCFVCISCRRKMFIALFNTRVRVLHIQTQKLMRGLTKYAEGWSF